MFSLCFLLLMDHAKGRGIFIILSYLYVSFIYIHSYYIVFLLNITFSKISLIMALWLMYIFRRIAWSVHCRSSSRCPVQCPIDMNMTVPGLMNLQCNCSKSSILCRPISLFKNEQNGFNVGPILLILTFHFIYYRHQTYKAFQDIGSQTDKPEDIPRVSINQNKSFRYKQ